MDVYVSSYAYDAANQLVRADFADAVVLYDYDVMGRLTRIDDSARIVVPVRGVRGR